MDESDLIRKAQEGDEAASAELFNLHKPHLQGVAFKILKNEQDAEEIVSDAFMKGVKTFDPGKKTKLSTWLHTITRNASIDKLRKSRKTISERNEEGGEIEKTSILRFVEPKEGESNEDLMDAARLKEGLNDDYVDAIQHLIDDYPESLDGIPGLEGYRIPSIEEYMKWKEVIEHGISRCVLDDKEGPDVRLKQINPKHKNKDSGKGSLMMSLAGRKYTLIRFDEIGKKETPPDGSTLSTEKEKNRLAKMLRKTSNKKTEEKSKGALYTAKSRMKKKFGKDKKSGE